MDAWRRQTLLLGVEIKRMTAAKELNNDATAEEISTAIYGSYKWKSKYGVDTSAKGKESRTYQNIVYHSKHEMEVYRDWVEPQIHIGILSNVHRQVPFILHAVSPGGFKVRVGVYKADFVATSRDGKPVIIDAKGMATPVYKLKRAIFEVEYGLRILEL
jgi:hypothetical protein